MPSLRVSAVQTHHLFQQKSSGQFQGHCYDEPLDCVHTCVHECECARSCVCVITFHACSHIHRSHYSSFLLVDQIWHLGSFPFNAKDLFFFFFGFSYNASLPVTDTPNFCWSDTKNILFPSFFQDALVAGLILSWEFCFCFFLLIVWILCSSTFWLPFFSEKNSGWIIFLLFVM